MRKLLFVLLFSFGVTSFSKADGVDKHVVVVVWDGMRPDFISEKNTPTLYELVHRGVFFARQHASFITSTEVNGTALATGDYPEHSGVMANREFRPELDPLVPIATESLEAMHKADVSGHYLAVPTLAETLQGHGYPTAIAGSKPVAWLQDHAQRPEAALGVVLSEGRSLPTSLITNFTDPKALGPFPESNGSKTNRDTWTTRALTELIWKRDVPAFSLLWLAEPDNTQHQTGVGSAAALAAIRNSDDALSQVIAQLKAKGVFDRTDIMVVSDHGFSTISKEVDAAAAMRDAGFRARREFSASPQKGEVLVVGLGGSALIYVIGHEEKTVARLVAFLETQNYVGTIFTSPAREGTFTLQDGLIHSAHAPDIVFSFRWTSETNANGAAGYLVSESEGSNLSLGSGQKATHASLSPFDLHNTLVAAGPDFRRGYVDEIPSGNVDIAPTVLKILEVKPSSPMDGRVLSEALEFPDATTPKVQTKELNAHATLSSGEWTQTLRISEVDGVRYFEEGTGIFTPRK
jgi:arylsulfatase A-like enzyme